MVTCKIIGFIAAVVVGLAMIVIGGAILGVFPKITDKKIKENLQIKKSGEAFDRFIESPVASHMMFYLFNVKNKDDVNNKNAKPELEEKGPYVYRQDKVKTILDWNEKEGTVKYKEITTYFFDESKSKGSLDDKINHVNAIAIGVRYNSLLAMIGKPEDIVKGLRGTFIETHTAHELLFGGIKLTETLSVEHGDLLLMILGQSPLVGFFTQKNDTDNPDANKPYEVYTGTNGMENFGEVITYDKKPELNFWYGPFCNAINGTDGKQFPPKVNKKEHLYVFSSDICRSMKFIYETDVKVAKIDTLRYIVPEYVFDDPNVNKDNMCFCQEESNKPCPSKKGVIPIFTCQHEKPVALSAPHFYFGEPEYKDKFVGLNPQKAKHETFLDIEPMTGTVLSGAKRIQMNLIIEPYDQLAMIKHIKELTYFPLFWIEEGGTIDEANAKDFRKKVTNPYKSGKWGSVSILIIGCIVVGLVAVLALVKGC